MNEWALSAWLALCAGDAASTHLAIRAGARETMMTQRPWVNTGVIAGQAAALPLSLGQLRKERPRLAAAFTIGAIAFRGFVVQHNIRAYRRQKDRP